MECVHNTWTVFSFEELKKKTEPNDTLYIRYTRIHNLLIELLGLIIQRQNRPSVFKRPSHNKYTFMCSRRYHIIYHIRL